MILSSLKEPLKKMVSSLNLQFIKETTVISFQCEVKVHLFQIKRTIAGISMLLVALRAACKFRVGCKLPIGGGVKWNRSYMAAQEDEPPWKEHLGQAEAAELDNSLFYDYEYSIDQLMEIAGLCVAEVCNTVHIWG